MTDDASKWRDMIMSGGVRFVGPKPGEWRGWPERQHSYEEMAEFLRVLAERAPIVVTEVPSSEFQFVLGTTAGTIQIWHEAMTADIDGKSEAAATLADWFRVAGPVEVNFAYERPILVLRAGATTIRVTPGRPESLNFWMGPVDLLIF